MNQCYRLVFNVAKQIWQAVAETAKSRGKSSGKTAAAVLLPLLFASNVIAETATNALPTGGQVISGQSTISQNGNQLNILQSTQKSIINWGSYSIGANSSVNYVQPNSSAISLNRVIGQDPSAIFGKLNANGQVWLINPNGILFGQSAQVNVGGLAASTLNILDDDFLSGNYKFTGNSGSVVNMGSIVANNGGYVAMLAPEVRNEGIISALEGSSILAAGDAITLDFNGNNLINVQVDSANINTLVENKNLIKVGGGQVIMSSKAADGLITSVINNSGRIEADSMISDGGVVRLTGAKTVINSGEISTQSGAGKGGTVHMLGENVGVFGSGSINVNGKTGGGTILVGGDFQGKNADIQNAKKTFISQSAKLNADATERGDGGKVIVWADDIARYYGSISAKGGVNGGNGGFAEVSGKRLLNFLGKADLSAANGLGGNLLLDPLNITLTTVDANTTGFTLPGDLTEAFADDLGLTSTFRVNAGGSFAGIAAGSTITLQATNDITVASAFNVTTATGTANNSLVLQANNNINVNAAVTTTGTGAITMNANADNLGGGNLAIGANIISQTGGIALSGVNITRIAGNIASTGAAGTLNGGNINFNATGAITLGAATITANGSGAATAGSAGNITLSAATGISGTGAITATGGASTGANQTGGNGGTVSVNNTGVGVVSVGAITATGGTSGTGNAAGGNAGSVTVANSGGNIIAGALTARTSVGIGTGADSVQGFITVNNTSAAGTIATGAINTSGQTNGHGGNISVTGNGNVTIAGTVSSSGATSTGTRAGRNAGNITITGANRSITGAINASGGAAIGAAQAGGNAGVVSITGTSTLSTVVINAQAGAATTTGAGGAVGGITLNGSTVVAGALTTTGGSNGNAGNIGVTSTGNMTVGAIAATGGTAITGNTGRNAGTVTLNSAGTITATTIAASGSAGVGTSQAGGNAAAINITGVGGITATAIGASGGAGTATNAAGGNAGAINIANSSSGNIGVTMLTSQAGVATGTGASGTAGGVSVINTAAGGNLTATTVTTSGGASGNGGNVTLSSLGTTTAGAIATSGATSTGIRTGRTGGNVSVTGAALTTGAITANGAAGIGLNQAGGNAGAVSLTATTGAIVTQAISATGGNGVATNANGGNGGAVNLDAGAGSTISMNNITTTGGNRAGGGTAGNGGNISVADNALLSANSTITATGGTVGGSSGTVNFAGTINSVGANRTLAINTAAATTLTGAIGNSLALASLTTNAGGTTAINGGAVTTTGAQTYNDAVTLGAATTFTTTNSNVTFGSSINAATNNVNIAAGTGVVTATNAANNFGNLAITAGSATIRDTNAIVLGATNVTGAYALQTNGAVTQTAGVTVGGATTIVAGAANDITLSNVANNFNSVAITSGRDVNLVDANALTVNASSVRTMTAQTLSNNLTLGGNITATGAGNAIVLASAGNFINANNILTPGTGRWLVYSTSPLLDARGALLTTASDFKQYNTTFGGSILGTGDGFIYSLAPTITPTLTGSATKTYNGTIAAPIGSLALGQSGAIDGDTITLGGLTSATYDTANAGTGKTVSASGISITSQVNGVKPVFGYQLASTTATGAVGTINQADITVSTSNVVKTYDGTTSALGAATVTSGTLFNNASNGGALDSVSGGTFAFTNPNVGLGNKTVTVAGVTVNDGNLGGNYNVTFANNTTSTINSANLTITANNQTKTYGNTFTFLGTEFTSTGLQNSETIGSATITSAGAVNTANVASYAINASAATGGTFNAANYTINYVNGTMTVNPAIIDLSGTRTYNGTTSFAAGTFGTINGVLGQTLSLAGTGSVASANAGAAQTLTTGTLALANGTGLATNYTLTGGTHTGTINQANLTISTSDVTKTYNGTLAAAGTAAVTSGTLFTNASNGNTLDTISSGTFAFTNANAGVGNKTVTTTGVTVTDGNAGGNYNVIYADNTTSTINKADITVSTGNVVKTYDGTTSAAGTAVLTSGALFNNASNGNVLDSLSGGTFAFTDKNFGVGNKTVTVSGVTTNDGNAGGNYNVTFANNTTSTINKAALSLNAVTDSKTYDGNTSSSSVVAVVGLQTGDSVTAAQSFDNKNAGARTLAVNSGFIVSDANGGANYTVTTNTAAGTIDPKALTVTANNRTKTYGQNINFAGTEFTPTGLVGGETIGSVTLNSAGAINTANVAGSPYAINASAATGGTFDANNYAITYSSGLMTVNRAPLNVTANNAARPQGSANPPFSSTITGFVNGETSAVLIGALGHSTPATTTSLVGNYAITPFGLSADNYTITFVDGVLTVGRPPTISALNGALTRPEQALQTCDGFGTNEVMISGLDDYGVDDIEYKESVSQPLVGGVVANALANPACLKL